MRLTYNATSHTRSNPVNVKMHAIFDRARTTMPPADRASLPVETYTNILTYVLELNGAKPGNLPLPSTTEALDKIIVP